MIEEMPAFAGMTMFNLMYKKDEVLFHLMNVMPTEAGIS
jgi:hypothetical protein